MSVNSKKNSKYFTYKSCSKLAFQTTLDASCLGQKFGYSAKTKHKEDGLQVDGQLQELPQSE